MTAAALPEPFLKIRPPRGWAPLNLRELWLFRDLLVVLAGRDLKLRYKQTALGITWVVFQPLLAAGIFSIVFGAIAKLPNHGMPYFVFSYAGLLAWNTFSNTLTKASTSLLGNSQLVSKIYFPRLVLPLSGMLSTMVDFGITVLLMAVMMLMYHIVPGPGLLLLPVWLVLLLLLALGFGLLAGAMSVSYRDVQYILPVLIPFLLYASPVGYELADVPQRLRLFFLLNPLTGLLEAFRWSLLGHGSLSVPLLAYSAGSSFAVFVLGAIVFKRMERRFADVI